MRLPINSGLMLRSLSPCVCLGLGLSLAGCVERTVKIDTRPTQAQVIINDEEVGLSPVKFSFKWYGDYDLVLRKEGYETLKTHFRIDAPWWQLPPMDLVTEVFVAETLRDDHVLEPFELQKRKPTVIGDLVSRAEHMRSSSRLPAGEQFAPEPMISEQVSEDEQLDPNSRSTTSATSPLPAEQDETNSSSGSTMIEIETLEPVE
jgi:hypothetical protein